MKYIYFFLFALLLINKAAAQQGEYTPSDTVFEKRIFTILNELKNYKGNGSEEAKVLRNKHALELYGYYKAHSNETTGQTALFFAYSTWWKNNDHDFIRKQFLGEDLEREEMWAIPFNQFQRTFWDQKDNKGLLQNMEKLTTKISNPKCLAVLYADLGEWNYYEPDIEASKNWFLKFKSISTYADSNLLIKAKTFLYEIDSLKIGMPAPDFEAIDLKGSKIKLSDLKGKVVLIDFWATWCKPCIAGLPHVKELNEKYKDRGDFQIIGISLDIDLDKWKKYVRDELLDWINICDGKKKEGEIVRLYNAMGIPKYYVVDKEGNIRFNAIMAKEGFDYEKIIESLLE